jgi:hypothetical protein
MSQPDITYQLTEPVDRVKSIKQLLTAKAALDHQINQEILKLTHEERMELYQDNHYFPEDGVYFT